LTNAANTLYTVNLICTERRKESHDDRSERKAKPITRQNLNVMISNHETRQRPETRRDAEPGGGVNLEVLQ
jgi:hypothetical protein